MYVLADGTRSQHRPVRISHRETCAEVDEKIAPLIVELWRAGWQTIRSCQHHGPSRKVWVEFAYADDAAAFLSVVAHGAPVSFTKRLDWCFACFRRHSEPNMTRLADAWELHAQLFGMHAEPFDGFAIGLSVLFPRRDLRFSLDQMRVFNSTEANEP